MKPINPRESLIVHACLQWLGLMGYVAWRSNSGAVTAEHNGRKRFIRFNSAPGMADICAVQPRSGRFVAIECKRVGGEATERQRAFLTEIERVGGIAVVVHSVDELREALT